jgi:hypothetical protein
MTNYPQDEFDRIPETSDRQGVHRAAMTVPKARGLVLVILAAGLALAVGLLSFFVLPLLGTGGAAESVASEPSAPATTAAATTAAPETTAAEETAIPSAEPTDEASEEPAEEPTAEESTAPEQAAGADRTDPVLVLNGTGTSGLGADVSATVTADGWQFAGVDNWTGSTLASSVIFYNPGQEANAQELSALLNIGDVRPTSQGEISDGLTVVLGPGFQ